MPPKGWRKDAQGNYPTTSYVKEQENITIHDLLFPKSVVAGLAKEAGNSVINSDDSNEEKKTMMINKDASLALQRSATVFVNHLLLFARELSREQDRKSCNVDDVLNALDQIGYSGFKSIIREKLDDYQSIQHLRKKKKKQQEVSTENETNKENNEDNDIPMEDANNQTPKESAIEASESADVDNPENVETQEAKKLKLDNDINDK
ncbi:hypothetical protein Kpol_543p46 [Vanderwaltozyma polyspora DSM 70294]|uniref:DNA polymerase epsilon subunit D n=1 Tax=Vanderwaltozyma polyspora (strain ATCC 22028 / DSM 70294 / BCRC 21397 / CBS 2163 / NBRC 10782 / NRRL Y-8283 / UCD 57-17) TaxID=436907 RepID=A7THQ0_VANPO|nr:uncharacterized protein Kpol_543p46 [Vanderwaltozyma polyspora DSM 70294]EDO18216.1 hypothetical protein Kpol_543p46 [Vanderwaltozyma polyspora DSM 70294]